MNKFKSLVITTAATALCSIGTAIASPTQELPYFTPSNCTPNCWDFTIYTNQQGGAPYGSTNTSNGFVEGFLSYNASTAVNGDVTAQLSALYLTTTGISTAGATTSLWAPFVNLSAPTSHSVGTNNIGGLSGGSTILSISGSNAGLIDTNNAVMYFSAGSQEYKIIMDANDSGAFVQYWNGSRWQTANSQNIFTGANGQYNYGSTSATQNNLGSGSFGGQIAPEMDAKSALNVLMLLGSLMLVFRNKLGFKRHLENLSA